MMVAKDTSNEARQCPACGFALVRERGTKSGFQMLSCRGCKTLYTSQLPDAETAEDYDSYYGDENLSAPDFINRRLDDLIGEFAPYKQNGRLLDVGFGAGTLMEAARRGGWTTHGVEVSRSAAEHVRALGFEVFCGTLHEAKYPDNHFDVVTASEVLEHVPDPQLVLNEIARIVRPGGLLWGTTPHGRGLSAHMLGLKWSVVSPPEHLQLFSVRGIRRMLKEAGFKKARVATEGVNPYELLQALRRRQPPAAPQAHSNARVESAYSLNEAMMSSPSRRLLKSTLNNLLNLGRIGDSLKIRAEK